MCGIKRTITSLQKASWEAPLGKTAMGHTDTRKLTFRTLNIWHSWNCSLLDAIGTVSCWNQTNKCYQIVEWIPVILQYDSRGAPNWKSYSQLTVHILCLHGIEVHRHTNKQTKEIIYVSRLKCKRFSNLNCGAQQFASLVWSEKFIKHHHACNARDGQILGKFKFWTKSSHTALINVTSAMIGTPVNRETGLACDVQPTR